MRCASTLSGALIFPGSQIADSNIPTFVRVMSNFWWFTKDLLSRQYGLCTTIASTTSGCECVTTRVWNVLPSCRVGVAIVFGRVPNHCNFQRIRNTRGSSSKSRVLSRMGRCLPGSKTSVCERDESRCLLALPQLNHSGKRYYQAYCGHPEDWDGDSYLPHQLLRSRKVVLFLCNDEL